MQVSGESVQVVELLYMESGFMVYSFFTVPVYFPIPLNVTVKVPALT